MHYFFSDVHLGLGSAASSRERERIVLSFFDMLLENKAESLYIVGDLFDYWFDYRTVIPRGFVRTLGGIARLVDAGVRVEYVVGNHDFGHRDFFQDELGVALHEGDVEVMLGGRRCYIAHGDGKAFNDTGYRILKKVLRARSSNMLFRFLHPDVGIGVAAYASRRSRDFTNTKNYQGDVPGEGDGLRTFAERKIRDEGFDVVIMGHNHSPAFVEHNPGHYVNLGTWLRERSYLVLGDDTLELRQFAG
ncbi:MAG: UDP-2,3-diacylglucosamine diphosphatase [bacterium]|nr:UDP-2,3-diacylglucosamine diphosphatase [Candidatus Kapabacteria bacterium]